MRCLFHFVVSLVVLAAAKTWPLEGSICRNVPSERCDVCISIKLAIRFSGKLFKLVKDYKDVAAVKIFSLREPETVTSIDDFYQELKTYWSILCFFKSSMEAFNTTAEYGKTQFINKEKIKIKNYFARLSRSSEFVEQTIYLMSNLTNQTSPKLVCQTLDLEPIQSARDIYLYTAHVTNKLRAFLRSLFESQCKVNNSNKKCRNNDIRQDKKSAKGKGREKCKGKRKGENKKNRGSKRMESKKIRKQ